MRTGRLLNIHCEKEKHEPVHGVKFAAIAGFLGTVLFLAANPGFAKSSSVKTRLSRDEIRRIENWESVVHVDKSEKHWKPTVYILMADPPPKVMHIVMQVQNYSRFMPRVKKSTVVRRSGRNRMWAVMVTDLPWPLRNAWVAVRYEWSVQGGNHYRLDWSRYRGSMRKYRGRMDFYEWNENHTLVKCTMQAVPDDFITLRQLNNGMVWAAEQMLHSLRSRLDALRKKHSLSSWVPD